MATDPAPPQLHADCEAEQRKSKFKRVNRLLLLMIVVQLSATSATIKFLWQSSGAHL
jgi:hypothetical protein